MSKSRKDLYKQIYKVTYIANINKMINETRYIDILQKLSMEGFKTYHIDDFDKLTLHLQSIGLDDSFNISILMHLRDTNYKKMSEVAVLFNDIGEIFAMKKKKMVDRMHNIRKILKRKLDMIRSFKKIEKINSFSVLDGMDRGGDEKNNIMNSLMSRNEIDDLCDTDRSTSYDDSASHDSYKKISDNLLASDSEIYRQLQSRREQTNILSYKQNKMDTSIDPRKRKMSRQKIEFEWRYHTKSDIIDRLHLLAETHFTLNQLRYMNIELKYVSDIEKMAHIDLERYYLDVVNKIDRSLKEWMTICRMYIDIEVNYVECCENMINGTRTYLDLKHFSIDIRNIQDMT